MAAMGADTWKADVRCSVLPIFLLICAACGNSDSFAINSGLQGAAEVVHGSSPELRRSDGSAPFLSRADEHGGWLDLSLRQLDSHGEGEEVIEEIDDALESGNETLSNDTMKEIEEVEEEQEALGATISVMLLGMVGFIMTIFYLVNCRSRLIRENTWYVINSTLSIFCAVLFFQAIHSASWKFLGYTEEEYSESAVVFDIVCFLLAWFVLSGSLHFLRPCPHEMRAVAIMGAHVTGFAAMYAFGEWQQLDSVNSSIWAALGVAGAFVFITCVLCVLSRLLRPTFSHSMHELLEESSSGGEEVPLEMWIDLCIETEDDVIALCLGFLISQLVRFHITGSLPPITGQPEGHDFNQITRLFLAGLGFQILAGASTYLVHVSRHPRNASLRLELRTRYATLFQDIVAMSMAWCTLMCGQWLFYTVFRIERVMARLLLALVASARAVVFVFILEGLLSRVPLIRKSSWRAVVDAEALLVGLTWERTFDAAVEGLGDHFERPAMAKCCISFGLIAIVWPAWRFYILPRSLERPKAPMSRSKSCTSSESGDTNRLDFATLEQDHSDADFE